MNQNQKKAPEFRKIGVYVILISVILIVMIVQLSRGKYSNAFLCVLTIILFALPSVAEKKIGLKIPGPLEITVLFFIFAAGILGEIQSYYAKVPFWDSLLHTVNGFVMAAVGFSMIDLFNNSPRFHMRLSPAFVVLTSFCFSVTIGTLWEFYEFAMDLFMKTDMQKDVILNSFATVFVNGGENPPAVFENIRKTVVYTDNGIITFNGYLDVGITDTMKDLMVNFVGAAIFSVFGGLYVKNRGKGNLIKNVVPLFNRQNK